MDLIEWIEARRVEQGLSLRKFSRILHTSPAQLSRLLTRQRPATDADLGRLVRAFPGDCERITALWESYRESWSTRAA